jgi:integrase
MMMYETFIKSYKNNEQKCPVCGEALPAHQTWPGHRHILCGRPECNDIFKLENPRAKYIPANTQRCSAEECENYLPEGWYWFRPTNLGCSPECWRRQHSAKGPQVPCGCGCGQIVARPASSISEDGMNFVNRAHLGEYNMQQTFGKCGPFESIAKEYFNGFAQIHYRTPKKHLPRLLPLFWFLNEQGFTDLEDVGAPTITAFLNWGKTVGRKTAQYSPCTLSTFFNWMIAEGRRKGPNPVIPLIHKLPFKSRKPRPLDAAELELLWKLLTERGNPRVRFAAAIAEEGGLRISEVCNLRLSDIDLVQQRAFIRLPNKTNTERWAFFGEKTKKYYAEWMLERDPDTSHDHVLHNYLSDPMMPYTLTCEFNRVLCKVYKGKKINEVGFDQWSFHRLRHTMASNLIAAGAGAATVMAAGGWKSHDAMAGYAKVDEDLARRGYDEAMRRAKDQAFKTPQRRSLTPADLLSRKGKSLILKPVSEEAEHCV